LRKGKMWRTFLCQHYGVPLFPTVNFSAMRDEKDVNSGRRFGYLNTASY